jgi:hypothetical protein
MVSDDIEKNDSEKKNIKLSNVLNDFELVEIIFDNETSKVIIIKAIDKNLNENERKNAVIIFKKSHFVTSEVVALMKSSKSIENNCKNDIYQTFSLSNECPFNS